MTYAYVGANRLLLRTDAKGQKTTYYYDNLNRLIGRRICGAYRYSTYPVGGTYQYQYNNMGRLASMTQYNPSTQTWPTIATATYGAANQMTSL